MRSDFSWVAGEYSHSSHIIFVWIKIPKQVFYPYFGILPLTDVFLIIYHLFLFFVFLILFSLNYCQIDNFLSHNKGHSLVLKGNGVSVCNVRW